MTVLGVADVNWLLSALAQATAALIAIVGGLLVSRYVSLHAEQQAARRRVEDLVRREDEARETLGGARSALDAYYVEETLDDDRVFEEIFTSELNPTVEGVLHALDEEAEDLNRELLASELDAMTSEMAAAIRSIHELVPVDEQHDDWSEFRRTHELEVGRRSLWEWVYEKVCDDRRREAKQAKRDAARKSPYGALLGLGQQADYSDLLRGISVPEITAANRMIISQRELARAGSLEKRIAEVEAELRALTQEHRLAGETYQATRQPEGFVLALQVLSFLAIAGMGVPVVLMGFAPTTLPAWARGGVIAVFFIGVAVLLRFLFVYAGFLREHGRATLPQSVLGLLWRAPRDSASSNGP